MNRIEFLKNSFVATGALVAGSSINGLAADKTTTGQGSALAGKTFNLDYAPHQGMFKNNAGDSFLDQIRFMHDQGFRSIEDNG